MLVRCSERVIAQIGKGKVIYGLLRKDEGEQVVRLFRGHYNIPLVHADASKQFLDALAGPSVTIKSHHNVGGLPARMNMKLVEPLRELFKDEVRELGLPADLVNRHPFPGLAFRIPGDITKENLGPLREVDAVHLDEIRKVGLYEKIWQTLRRAAAGAHRGRDGRRPHRRPVLRAPRYYFNGWNDGRLFPVRPRFPRPRRQPHHQRGARHQSRDLRHHEQATGGRSSRSEGYKRRQWRGAGGAKPKAFYGLLRPEKRLDFALGCVCTAPK